jgi:hypothetical protein
MFIICLNIKYDPNGIIKIIIHLTTNKSVRAREYFTFLILNCNIWTKNETRIIDYDRGLTDEQYDFEEVFLEIINSNFKDHWAKKKN